MSITTRIIKTILLLALIVLGISFPTTRLYLAAAAIAVIWMPGRWFGDQPKTQN